MQDIKFKISNTEAANIEIVPVHDGVEIVVHYGEREKKKFTFHEGKTPTVGNNAEILKSFCGKIKEYDDTDLKELKKFYKFYEDKALDWRGKMDCEKLWERWQETAK